MLVEQIGLFLLALPGYLLTLLERLIALIFSDKTAADAQEDKREKAEEKCEDTLSQTKIVPEIATVSEHSNLVNSVNSISSTDDSASNSPSPIDDKICDWEPFNIAKELPIAHSVSFDTACAALETPTATFNSTIDSMTQQSFELYHSGCDETVSESMIDALISVVAVPPHSMPRSQSVVPPRYFSAPKAKSESAVRRQTRTLILRQESLSLSLDGLTDLMLAAWDNDLVHVKRLINTNQVRLQAEQGYTALMLAGRNRSVNVILLLAGREAGIQNNQGKTATMIAVETCNDEILQLLIGREGGYQDNWGNTALMHAALLGRLDIAERLVPYDVGKHDREGRTALIISAYCGHTKLLTKLSAEIRLGGFTSLMYYAAQGSTDELEAHINLAGNQDVFGRTALMYAAINGYLKVVQALAPFESRKQANWGGTALTYSILYGYSEIVELLLPFEADLTDIFSRAPLDHALNPMHTDMEAKQKVLDIVSAHKNV